MSEGSDDRTEGLRERYNDAAIKPVEGNLRRWHLFRISDATGMSGEGVVASGVMFHDGTVAYKWRTDPSTVQFAECIDDVIEIHGHGGKTKVVWEDNP